MDINHQLTTIFCQLDDFCKDFEQQMEKYSLPDFTATTTRGPQCGLSSSEIMTILLMFHQVRFRDFKTYYEGFIIKYWREYFPAAPSYARFVTLMKRAFVPLTLFTQSHYGKKSHIYYIDSSLLPACHIKRSKRNKVFEGIADYGKSSIGWFFGLKIHIVINHQGELMAFKITRGSYHDNRAVTDLFEGLEGLAFGDKGYISKKLMEKLLEKGLKLITRMRKNMKNKPTMTDKEKQLLNQRGIIETVIGYLKYHYQIWHTRHRSVLNAMTHLVAALAAYVIEPMKISAIKMLMCERNMIG